MNATNLQNIFIQWLNTVLQDEQWRDAIRAQLHQHELPVIELRTSRQTPEIPKNATGAPKPRITTISREPF